MKSKRHLIQLAVLTLTLAFTLLTFYISANPIPSFDHKISLLLQKYHSDVLDKIMIAISLFGELPYSFVMIFLVSIGFYRLKYKRESLFVLSILLSGLIILGIKNIIDRPRPTEFYVRLVEINRFQSYPSGHVLSYILFFGFMIILMKQLTDLSTLTRNLITYISMFFIITIPFSRVYLGAHWFSDTLAGFILGLICLIILSYLYLRPLKKNRG
ncbi:phosphatase PAP2 family protein [Pedobacter insulae]|uniref:Undecaprenyl-diphosphatase n=1 Tax=Pedobacter insulae TaxID=414048 RepID=A0A1I2YIQ6_9SPHI|nr:phosphatase PAP2 family protein [Pedobacter insulae]SFH25515.1 undecaprenyl-diphosphatase [Pedobacter insulae]